MEVRVRFRFNKKTGEVEVFDVEDEGTMRLPEAEHNREHDRIAAELGNVIERNPRVIELFPEVAVPVSGAATEPPFMEEPQGEPIADKERQKQKQ